MNFNIATFSLGASALPFSSVLPATQDRPVVTPGRLAPSFFQMYESVRGGSQILDNIDTSIKHRVVDSTELAISSLQLEALEPQLLKALTEAGVSLDRIKDGLQLWSQEHRGYHSLEHLNQLVGDICNLDSQTVNESERHVLLLTAFFHDVIYQPGMPDNEDQSRDYYVQSLDHGVLPDQKVIDCILATKEAKPLEPQRKLERLFWLLDNAVVYSADFDQMLKWEAGVFKEFGSNCPLDFYIEKRVEFLEGRLDQTLDLFKSEKNIQNMKDLIAYVKNLPKVTVV